MCVCMGELCVLYLCELCVLYLCVLCVYLCIYLCVFVLCVLHVVHACGCPTVFTSIGFNLLQINYSYKTPV